MPPPLIFFASFFRHILALPAYFAADDADFDAPAGYIPSPTYFSPTFSRPDSHFRRLRGAATSYSASAIFFFAMIFA